MKLYCQIRTPRSDTVARMLLSGCSLQTIAHELRCSLEDVGDAIRRRFDTLDAKHHKKQRRR